MTLRKGEDTVETAFYNRLMKERLNWGYKCQEDEEDDVGNYWMTLRIGEDAPICSRKL